VGTHNNLFKKLFRPTENLLMLKMFAHGFTVHAFQRIYNEI